MSIEDRLRVVKLAEIDCEYHADKARAAWGSLKVNFKDAATPWRIVTVGAIGGFFMGRSGGGDAGEGVGAKLFGTVANALITTLGASATAGMAAGAAANAAATATVDAVADSSITPEQRVAAAKGIGPENGSITDG